MRNSVRNLLLMMAATLMLSFNASADAAKEEAIRSALSALDARVPIVAIQEAQFPGLYEVTLASGELLYANETGSHFIVGEVYKVKADGMLVNLSEEGKKVERVEQLVAVKTEDMVVFPADGDKKAHVTIYTDVDCFYCRKLHKEMKQITAKGIEVRYLAFPRAGAGSAAHKTMDAIWCADKSEQGKLMTRAKSGQSIPADSCAESPVLEQWQLGQKMGISGTPALILEDGSLVPGYVPADQLAKMLGVAN
ncbi:DsbC family protein [Amphritea balenae]|uniref:Thiol:disulfide interchange protein n=1 Tax=Amphritea balenae TaxID=452629 RepID=A0A3P1SN29_9GAMM|nr:DsbC family protein [Amphritea balenae]RRC98527.1 DsbC family protein [Amphritea balenae]GGK65284.1 glutaredoxin [Amphritea balenae]